MDNKIHTHIESRKTCCQVYKRYERRQWKERFSCGWSKPFQRQHQLLISHFFLYPPFCFHSLFSEMWFGSALENPCFLTHSLLQGHLRRSWNVWRLCSMYLNHSHCFLLPIQMLHSYLLAHFPCFLLTSITHAVIQRFSQITLPH